MNLQCLTTVQLFVLCFINKGSKQDHHVVQQCGADVWAEIHNTVHWDAPQLRATETPWKWFDLMDTI